MDTNQIVQALTAERDRLNAAIAALTGGVKRRGRPPKAFSNGAVVTASTPSPRTTGRTWTAAQKRAAAARMKARWSTAKKKGANKV